MHVAILHQFVPDDASADERDVLVQVEAVSHAILELGNTCEAIPCSLDLDVLKVRLAKLRPDVVFNLVESLGGTDSLQPLVPLVVESLGLRMTGSSAAAILNSGRKQFAKWILRQAGLSTPDWFTDSDLAGIRDSFHPGRYILKPLFEHASLGMADADVVTASTACQLSEQLAQKQAAFGRPCFAEEYVDGREFNLSLLETDRGIHVMPPAEIRFVDYPEGKPRIVGTAAKWDEASFEYAATVRSFTPLEVDGDLKLALKNAAVRCWHALELRGYARVDFRVDDNGRPWILEANANPCLSPDAGFAAALDHEGIGYQDAIELILAAAQPPVTGRGY